MWPNLQETADLVTFIEEILGGKLHFLCSVTFSVLDLLSKFFTWELCYMCNFCLAVCIYEKNLFIYTNLSSLWAFSLWSLYTTSSPLYSKIIGSDFFLIFKHLGKICENKTLSTIIGGFNSHILSKEKLFYVHK